jgi:ribose-phosphate pyrophosphokinase
MYVIPTSGAEHLARGLESQEGIKIILPARNKEGARFFPDGEIYTRISEVAELKDKVVVLHSGQPDPNAGIIELEMILEILRRAGVGLREVFFNYFPYAMQDKAFQPGEVNAAEALLRKLTAYYGVSQVYAIDPHFHRDEWASGYTFTPLTAVPLLKAAALRDQPEMIFVAPDSGGKKRTSLSGLSKTRTDSYTIELHHDDDLAAMISGKHVGVVDDLVETGGTMARFAEKAKEYGAKSVSALITHGILPEGIARIQGAYDKLYLANTVNRTEANVDIAPVILQVLRPPPLDK